jgi:hypothetical protein
LTTLFIILSLPLFISYTIAHFTKQSTAFLIPVSYFLSILWLFVFGVADHLELGVNLLFPTVIAVFILCAVKAKDFINLTKLKALNSPAIAAFVVVGTWTFKHSQHMRFKEWDEFSHWGPAVKSMFLFDKIGPYSPAQLVFPEYPPGLSLFSYYVTKIGGTWDEADVYWAYQILVISLIASILVKLTWKNKPAVIFASLIAALSAVFYFGAFQTVYADPLFALFFGFSLIVASTSDVKSNKWTTLTFSISIAILSITKDIGVFLALISILVYAVNIFFLNPMEKRSFISRLKHPIMISLLSIVPIFILKITWKFALDQNDIKPGRDFFTIFGKLVSGNSSDLRQPYWQDVTNYFISRTLHQSLTAMNSYSISAIKWVIIFSILFLISVSSQRGRSEKIRETAISTVIIIGFFGYLGVLLFLYLTSFSQPEALGLASYDRYVTTYFAALALLVAYKSLQRIDDFNLTKSAPMITFAWLILIMLQSSPWNLLSYAKDPNSASDQIRAQYDAERKMIDEMNFKVDDNVWFIAEHTVGFEFYMFQYELLPASVGRSPWSIGSPYGAGDIWTDTNLTADKWNDRLDNFEFVFIHSVTESFIKEFGSMFEDPSTLTSPGIYRVEHGSDRNLMVKVR